MISRRRAVAEVLLSAVALVLHGHSRKIVKQRDDYDDPPAISAEGFVTGILYQLAFHSGYDRDVGQIRTNKYRGLAYGIFSVAIQRWLFPDQEFRYSFNSGGLVGTILYRLWYGVLHPVPSTDQ